MSKCRNCGKDVSANAKVCPHCGEESPGNDTQFVARNLVQIGVGLAILLPILYWIFYQIGRAL